MHASRYSSDLFLLAEEMPFNDVHFWRDSSSQLEAVIAIHSTKLGPALGGCRCVPYESGQQALKDALRLAHGMSMKSAINRLPFGGGKAVILKPDVIKDRAALFESFGEFVDSLNGRYITAMDSGTSLDDINVIARKTHHVVCSSIAGSSSATGDPSPHTARGVYYGIKAAVKFQMGRDTLDGLHVAIQGVGHVGYELAKLLYADGVKLTITDVDEAAIQCAVDNCEAQVVSVNDIFKVSCDIFSPCALGQTINSDSIELLNTKIIAGSANNQLQSSSLAQILINKDILYAPDYVINSGGILQIAYPNDDQKLNQKLAALYDTLLDIFEASMQQQVSTEVIANRMAESVLAEDSALH